MDTILSLFLLVLYHAEIVHGAVVFCDSVNYTIISDTRRSTALRSKQPHICDKEIIVDDHWYRFKSAAGNTIPTVNPGTQRCGALIPIWFQGTHPTTENLVVDGKACAAIPFYQPPGCGISFSIKVVKCPGDFYLYRLKKPASCGFAYCAGDKIASPIIDTPSDVVPTVVFCDSVNYTIISDTRRSTALRSKQPYICDQKIIVDDHWYRFKSAAGNTIPTVNPGTQRCGALIPIWFQGTHPTTENLVVDGKACAAIPFYQPPGCGISFSIKVVKCSGDFYLYRLKKPASCGFAYCAGDKIVSPIIDTPSDVVLMDVSTKLSATLKTKSIDVVTTSKQIYTSAGARFASTVIHTPPITIRPVDVSTKLAAILKTKSTDVVTESELYEILPRVRVLQSYSSAGARIASSVIHTPSVDIPMDISTTLAAILKTKPTDVVAESELYEILPRVRVLQSYSSAGDRIPSPVLHSLSENMPMEISTKLAATVKTKSTDVVTTSALYGSLPTDLEFNTLAGVLGATFCDSVNYTIINDTRRSTAFESKTPYSCDRGYIVEDHWYRFQSAAGNTMPTTNPGLQRCGTYVPIWFQGTHPSIENLVVDAKACAAVPYTLPVGCGQSFAIKVVKCPSDFYLYRLKEPTTCASAYCAGDKIASSVIHTTSIVSDARVSITPPLSLSANFTEVVKPLISAVLLSSTVADARVSTTLPFLLSSNSTEVVKPLISTVLPSSTVAGNRIASPVIHTSSEIIPIHITSVVTTSELYGNLSTILPIYTSTNVLTTLSVTPSSKDVIKCEESHKVCHSNAICTNSGVYFSCKCRHGFTGDGKQCFDLDECNKALDDCHQNATCINTPGSYFCKCAKGLIGDGKQKCSRPGLYPVHFSVNIESKLIKGFEFIRSPN
ncbi:uncharacterized protein LOC114534659 [Dendronephthya gigantea]|uniref:uncharacterized protein LOC114534659 n=1 Tax=Dendronephthya gigantea TaxID=151771 RepID=UPI0010690028|nr:uncharacterized protein LOC114534659 [Dendronephthya gigantea]